MCPKQVEAEIQTDICTSLIAALFTVVKGENKPNVHWGVDDKQNMAYANNKILFSPKN